MVPAIEVVIPGTPFTGANPASEQVATAYETVLGQLQRSVPTGLSLAGRGPMFASPSELVKWADNDRTGIVGGPDVPAAARDAFPI